MESANYYEYNRNGYKVSCRIVRIELNNGKVYYSIRYIKYYKWAIWDYIFGHITDFDYGEFETIESCRDFILKLIGENRKSRIELE